MRGRSQLTAVAPSGDVLTRDGDDLVIASAVHRELWEPTKFRRLQVIVDGVPYFVARVERDDRRRYRYRLTPWPAELRDRPQEIVTYDAAFLAAERSARRAEVAARGLGPLALVLGPVLGFLPARSKRWLHDRFGIHPVACTRQSLVLEYIALALATAVLVIDRFTGNLPELRTAAWICGVLTGLDVAFRYGPVFDDDLDAPGFWEWLWRALVRRRGGR